MKNKENFQKIIIKPKQLNNLMKRCSSTGNWHKFLILTVPV